MSERRILAREQVPSDQQETILHCFYCYCPKHPRERKAVAAIEAKMVLCGQTVRHYYGICGYHAEVYPFTEEERQQRPMYCSSCFPRERKKSV